MSENSITCENASIEVKGVRKSFGQVQALSGVDLKVDSGEIFVLLGPNGSGKTTLVRILTTLLKPDSGIAWVAGYNVVNEASRIRSLIGLAGQYPAVDENLKLGAPGMLSWAFNDVAVGPSGAIYITGDIDNVIYRIWPRK